MSFKKYLTRKLSVQKSRLTNILPTTHLPHTSRLSQVFRHHILYSVDQLPPKVDLRPDMTSIENQSSIGSSVANCLTGAYEYLTKKSNGRDTDVSRLFIYYNARIKDNEVVDSGCSMTDAIKALEKFGTCLESIWPYDISRVNTRPNDEAYEQAENHKINKALQINIDLIEMKSCLAQGFPFAFCLKLYSSFDKAAQAGVVPIPYVWEQGRQSNGSHAMLAVGYSDRSNAFMVRNSWGEDWGDKGYCYIPYDYMTNLDLCFDVWTIRKVANSDFSREYWHSDDLVNYLSNCTIETVNENNEEEYSTDSNNQTNWRDYYYNRKTVIDDSWDRYRTYDRNQFSINNDDYSDNRYRRDRYDRDNDPYDQQTGGYTNNTLYSNRNFSYPFDNQYQNEGNYYDNYDDNHRRSMF